MGQDFDELLAAFDDRLAAGASYTPADESSVPDDVRPRLTRALECLEQIERLWPRSSPHPGPLSEGARESLSEVGGHSTQVCIPGTENSFTRFQIVRELGRGGGGAVFLAVDPLVGRKVALKVPRPEVLVTPTMRRRFLREAEAAGGLSHPNIVAVYEAAEVGPVCYIASEYIEGPTLAAWLKEQCDPVPIRDAARIVAKLADGVAHAHSRGILHRDIKPSNVMLKRVEGGGLRVEGGNQNSDSPSLNSQLSTLNPKLTDFGLAKLLERDGSGDQTRTGEIMGTTRYMAPEQAEGRSRDVGTHTDVYALGAVLYELLTGRAPHEGTSDPDTLRRIVSDEPVSPRVLRGQVPRDLAAICLKCLEKEPRRRYSSAAALGDDLRRFLDARPTDARPLRSWEVAAKWARRRPAWAAMIAVACIAVVLLWVRERSHRLDADRQNRALGKALNAEQQQREWANEKQKVAEDRERFARRHLYATSMRLVQKDVEEDKLIEAVTVLHAQRPKHGEEDLRGFEWRYWWHRCRGGKLFPMSGHLKGVISVAFFPDGQSVVSGSADESVRVWDVATGQNRKTLLGHRKTVGGVAVSPNGKWIASGSDDSVVKLWDAVSGELRATIELRSFSLWRVRFSPDSQTVLVVCGRWARLFDVNTAAERASFSGGPEVLDAVFSPDGQVVATAQNEGVVKIWDIATGAQRAVLQASADPVKSIAFSPDGFTLITGGDDHLVRVWDVTKRQLRRSLEGHSDQVYYVAYSPNGQYIASSDLAECMRVWNAETLEEVTQVQMPENVNSCAVESPVFSPDSTTIAISHERTVWLWRFLSESEATEFRAHDAEVWSVAFSPDSRWLVTAGDDHQVKLWDTATLQELAVLRGHDSLVTSAAFSRDGRMLATGSFDATINIWDTTSPYRSLRTLNHGGRVKAVAFSPSGKLLASCCDGKNGSPCTVKLWDTASGALLQTLDSQDGVGAVAFSPDDTTVASAGDDQTINIWDSTTGQLKQTLASDSAEILCLTFSRDGHWLASGSFEQPGVVKLWNARTWELAGELRGHEGAIRSVAFSPDSQTLASASDDQTIQLWDPLSRQALTTLRGHDARVNSVAFAPDGTNDGVG